VKAANIPWNNPKTMEGMPCDFKLANESPVDVPKNTANEKFPIYWLCGLFENAKEYPMRNHLKGNVSILVSRLEGEGLGLEGYDLPGWSRSTEPSY
jgi:hypothetical protein